MPLGMHIATCRPGPDQLHGFQNIDTLSPSFLANTDHWVRMSLGDMIFSGVFERYPQSQSRHGRARAVLDSPFPGSY